MKTVVVTGGTGFIGSALTARLRQEAGPRGIAVRGLGTGDVDLTDQGATFDYFHRLAKEGECATLYHLAAVYKAGGWPEHHPATQYFANMSINVNLLEAWYRYIPRAKLVCVLSYCMYPPGDQAHSEDELWGTEPESYLYSYAMTKKALLVGLKAYKHEYGLSGTSVVLPTVYGPGDSFAEDSHVMGALIGKFVRAKTAGLRSVEVWGDGQQEREFLHIDDAVDGLLTMADESDELVQNLGVGEAAKISTIAEYIRASSGYRGDIAYNVGRFVGVKRRLLDISRVQSATSWKPKIGIADGIAKTVEWYANGLAR
jgi:GDP-L-fucose synthase